ncbi:MAG: hypothetical protein ACOCX4_03805, partial [Planctomycetota bacterium]
RPSTRRASRGKRMQAQVILYIASLILAGLGALALYHIFFAPDPEVAAQALLDEAEDLAGGGQPEAALDALDELLRRFPQSRAAGPAGEMRNRIDVIRRTAAIERSYNMGGLTPQEAIDKVLALLDRAPPGGPARERVSSFLDRLYVDRDGAADDGDDDTAAVPDASEAYAKVLEYVERQLAEGDHADAAAALRVFVQDHAGAPQAAQARERLASIVEGDKGAFEESLARAREAREEGRFATAWGRLERLLARETHPDRRDAVRAAMLEIDAEIRQRFYAVQREAWNAFANLKPDGVRRTADDLALKLDGLPWRKPAEAMEIEARLVGRFLDKLLATVDATADYRAGIPGVEGEARLESAPGDALAAIAESGRRTVIGWTRVPEVVVWDLLPPGGLGVEERLGAAMYFLGRRHFGYALSYLEGLPASRTTELFRAEVLAGREARRVVDVFDFAADRRDQNERWVPAPGHEGNIDTSVERLVLSGEHPRALLRGRFYRLANLAINADLTLGPEGGECRLEFDAGDDGVFRVHLRRDGTALSLLRGEEEIERRDGPGLEAQSSFRLHVRDGRAVLGSGGDELCALTSDRLGRMLARLRIACDAATAEFDNVFIEEGP